MDKKMLELYSDYMIASALEGSILYIPQRSESIVTLTKANLNLTGYRKIYVDNKRVRIVYKIINNTIKVFVIAIGKRDDMEVYKKTAERLKN
jgi:hypothetical protein